MSNSIRRALASAREEWLFWREFADSTSRRFATGEIARIVAAQEYAERKLCELERAVSTYEKSDGKVVGGAAGQVIGPTGQARSMEPGDNADSSPS